MIIATHLATLFLRVLLLPEKCVKTCSSRCLFYNISHKNSIDHLLKASRKF